MANMDALVKPLKQSAMLNQLEVLLNKLKQIQCFIYNESHTQQCLHYAEGKHMQYLVPLHMSYSDHRVINFSKESVSRRYNYSTFWSIT